MSIPATTGPTRSQGDQTKPDGNPSLEELALEEIDQHEELDGDDDGDEDDDDGDDDQGEPGDGDGTDGGDQTDKGGDEKPPKKKYAGRFDTPEEMEAELLRLQASKTEQPPPPKKDNEEAIPDLNERELTTFSEQDEADGTNYLEGYLRQKMADRNLQPHELAALRRIDSAKNTDLYGEYTELRAARAARRENAPLAERAHNERVKAFQESEAKIDETNKEEFGDQLAELEKYTSNPKNVEEILKKSPVARIIMHEHEKGSPATAHKLLLREAAAMIRTTRSDKTKRSVRADVGTGAAKKPAAKTAASIDEAVEQYDAENDQ